MIFTSIERVRPTDARADRATSSRALKSVLARSYLMPGARCGEMWQTFQSRNIAHDGKLVG